MDIVRSAPYPTGAGVLVTAEAYEVDDGAVDQELLLQSVHPMTEFSIVVDQGLEVAEGELAFLMRELKQAVVPTCEQRFAVVLVALEGSDVEERLLRFESRCHSPYGLST